MKSKTHTLRFNFHDKLPLSYIFCSPKDNHWHKKVIVENSRNPKYAYTITFMYLFHIRIYRYKTGDIRNLVFDCESEQKVSYLQRFHMDEDSVANEILSFWHQEVHNQMNTTQIRIEHMPTVPIDNVRNPDPVFVTNDHQVGIDQKNLAQKNLESKYIETKRIDDEIRESNRRAALEKALRKSKVKH